MRRRPPLVLLLLALLVLSACARQDTPGQEPPAAQAEPGDDPAAEPFVYEAAVDTPGPAPAPAAPAPGARPAPGEEALTGRIAITGTALMPSTTLQVEGERSATLVGDLEEELRRLSGVTVRVYGRDAGEAPLGRRFEVRRYELLAVDGERPHVGTLLTQAGATWLATASDTLRIARLPEPLQGKSGARVWIVGPVSGGALEVQSFGIIRPE